MRLTGRVLVTGGAGFLARALYRRAAREGWDAEFTALSRDDAKHAALQARYPAVQCVLADVGRTPVEELSWLMRGYDLVIHAAASKYVDRSESETFDSIQTNVEGSKRVAHAAIRARVPKVIGISTDKAAMPVNVYGATKMLMERLFQEADRMSPATAFHVVRYGNVVGSTGSVIPIFERLRDAGEAIRLTNPAMTRFWMSVDEAIDLVLWALLNGHPGHLVVPRMRALSMGDLVRALLGYEAAGPVPTEGVEIIGERPGEKHHEALLHPYETVRATQRGGYTEIAPPGSPPTRDEGYSVSSANPPGGWVPLAEMREIIADAKGV